MDADELRGNPSVAEHRQTSARRLVIIDDHRTFVELLRYAIDDVPGLLCVGVAYDPRSGLELVERERPDIVVMDYEFPGPDDGITATAMIRSRHPDIHVVLLAGRPDRRMMQRAANAGANSLLPKDGSLPDFLDALRRAGPGGMLVHPSLLTTTNDHVADGPLSPREQEVLTMLAVGLNATEIADQLGITKNTCRGYIKTLLWKLGAHTQLEAVALARRRHLIADP